MKPSIQMKLEKLKERHEELGQLLSDPDVIGDQKKFREYSKEYAELEPMAHCFSEWEKAQANIVASKALLDDPDPEMKALARDELESTEQKCESLESELQLLMLPKDPDDDKNVFLEIRAGTGGDEAAIFAGDLARMYMRYAESRRWQVEIINESHGEHGGFKEIIMRLVGAGVYGYLKFESGAHRVQRVPQTEAQGRIHTSACTVAVMTEADEIDEIKIDPSELRVDTYRASGAGGQHVNKTDSAVRLTHIPTGIVVECQDERSQHKNRAKAMSLLQSKILTQQQDKQKQHESETRKLLVGSGDRSERIRTYNFPQGRVTDHRINLTLYKLDQVMEGAIDEIVEALRQEYQADQLAELAQE